jgi:hypothetical protein
MLFTSPALWHGGSCGSLGHWLYRLRRHGLLRSWLLRSWLLRRWLLRRWLLRRWLLRRWLLRRWLLRRWLLAASSSKYTPTALGGLYGLLRHGLLVTTTE